MGIGFIIGFVLGGLLATLVCASGQIRLEREYVRMGIARLDGDNYKITPLYMDALDLITGKEN